MATTTRREFLRRTLTAAAGAAAAPFILPGRALGAAGQTALSERVTLGLIGMGKMCSGHLGGLLGRSGVNRGVLVTEPEALSRETLAPGETRLYESADHTPPPKGGWRGRTVMETRAMKQTPALRMAFAMAVMALAGVSARQARPQPSAAEIERMRAAMPAAPSVVPAAPRRLGVGGSGAAA